MSIQNIVGSGRNVFARAAGVGALAVAGALAGCATGIGQQMEKDVHQLIGVEAKADIKPLGKSGVTGQATFFDTFGRVGITVSVGGLTPGSTNAVHLHQKADCSAPDGSSAGPHWNPGNSPHGGHAGDMPNLVADDNGRATMTYYARKGDWTLTPGDRSVLNHAIIVHANADDGVSQPAGNAGARIACGETRPA